MKISELISQLECLKKEHGDLNVYAYDNEYSSYYDVDVEVEVATEGSLIGYRIPDDLIANDKYIAIYGN